jgi:hypothetical protein
MRTWKTPPDLFAPPRPVADLKSDQRAVAVELLEALLKEAMATLEAPSEASGEREARDDQDHR